MANDLETSSSSEESSSDSDEEQQKPVAESVERRRSAERTNAPSDSSSSESEESSSEDSESQDSKTEAAKTKPRASIATRSEKTSAAANGVKKVEPEKNGKGEATRAVYSKSVTAAEAVETPPAPRGDSTMVAASRAKAVVGDKNKSRPPSRTESTKVTVGDKKRPNSAPQDTGAPEKKGRNSKTAVASSRRPHKWLEAEEIALAEALRTDTKNGVKFPKEKGNEHWQSMMDRLNISDPPLNISQFHEKIRRMKSKYLRTRKKISSYSPAWRSTHDGRLYKMWDSIWGRGSQNSLFTDGEGYEEDDEASGSEDEEARRDEVKVKSTSADVPPTIPSLDALSLWHLAPPGVAFGKRLPELRDTPPEFRKSLLKLKKRRGELYREQLNVAVVRLKSILQQCEVERKLSLLQYETEEFLARLPVKSLV